MTKFLKLVDTIVNTNHIHTIQKVSPSLYKIHVNSIKHNGFYIAWIGWIDATPVVYEIDKKREPREFDIISEWFDQVS